MNDLEKEKLKFASLFYGAQTPIVIFRGKEMIVEMYNESYHNLYHKHDILNKPFFDTIIELRDTQFPSILKKVYETGETFVLVEGLSRIRNRQSGKMEDRYFDTTFSRIDWGEEGVYRILAMPREVTERVVYRKLLEEEKSFRDLFTSTITHDLINPLSVINISLGTLAKKSKEPEEVVRLMARMKRGVDKARKLIDDLLELKKIQAGEYPKLSLYPCCLKEILEKIVQNLEGNFPGRIELFLDAKSANGFWDKSAIQRILNTLVENAIRYGSPEKKVSIRLNLKGSNVYLSVHNYGNPILLEDQDLIFKKHYRGQHAVKLKQNGWGIGLTLVKGLCEVMEGDINFISNEESGTTFTVQLPIKN